MEQTEFLPAEPLIPQRRLMKLIEWVTRPMRNGLLAKTTVAKGWPLKRDEMVDSLICIELVAQAIAALSTWHRGEGARPRVGLLVGIKDVEFFSSTIPVGTPLTIQIDEVYHVGEYAVFGGKVSSDSALVCKIIIQVMEPGEEIISNLMIRETT